MRPLFGLKWAGGWVGGTWGQASTRRGGGGGGGGQAEKRVCARCLPRRPLHRVSPPQMNNLYQDSDPAKFPTSDADLALGMDVIGACPRCRRRGLPLARLPAASAGAATPPPGAAGSDSHRPLPMLPCCCRSPADGAQAGVRPAVLQLRAVCLAVGPLRQIIGTYG